MPTRLLRTFSISKLEEYLKEEESYRKNAPDKPIHTGVESLFSTESGFNNFRGLLNLVLILLSVSSLRSVLENINRYGILADPFLFVKFFANDSDQWPAFTLIIYMQLFLFHAYIIEKLLAKNFLNEKLACLMKIINLVIQLCHPAFIIWTSSISPFISAPLLIMNTIVFLKLWSYGQVNYWCRSLSRFRNVSHVNPIRPDALPKINITNSSSGTPSSEHSLRSSNTSLTCTSQDTSEESLRIESSSNVEVVTSTTKCCNCQKRKHRNTQVYDGENKCEIDRDLKTEQNWLRGSSQRRQPCQVKRRLIEKRFHRRSFSACDPEVLRFSVSDTRVTSSNYKKFNSVAGFGPPILGTFQCFDKLRYRKHNANGFNWQSGLVFQNLDRREDPKLYSIPTMVDRLSVSYPDNLNISDFAYFMFAPTLCYELNFPRTLAIRKKFLAKRLFELIFLPQLMLCLIQQWIFPILQKETQTFATTRSWSVIVERVLRFAIPNHIIWILGFYVIFHAGLNVLAELMRFGDRLFYKDWWNAESVQCFWSTWNIPVHRWCRRHVYVPLLNAGFSRDWAGLVVFFVSAFFHEFLASVPLKMFRCWAFLGMLTQVPYAYLVRFLSPSGGKLGNIAVWITLIIGQPLAILMYLHDYYLVNYFEPNNIKIKI